MNGVGNRVTHLGPEQAVVLRHPKIGSRLDGRFLIVAVVFRGGLDDAAKAARKGADYTATIAKAKPGRASYISEEKILGHNDPGAEAVARLLENLGVVSEVQ